MRRDDLLSYLTNEIVSRKNENRPLRVAIDGRGASGKTVLANELASTIIVRKPGMEILRPSVDGFHHNRERRYRQGEYSATGYYEDAYDYQTLIDHLLAPLSGTVFPVLCRQVSHDVRTDMADIAALTSISANSILLFDGVFLFRRKLNSYWDFRILLDVDAETSISRALTRDGGVSGPADVVRKKYELRYEAAWQIYVREEHPELQVDLIVDNRDIFDPKITKPIG
jgi:uridine kinase